MTTSDTPFSEQLRRRFAEVGLSAETMPGQQVYTLSFAQSIRLHFIDGRNREVEVMAEAGKVDDRGNARSLLALLGCSPFGMTYPIALHCDKESGAVLLWTRVSLTQLGAAGFELLVTSMLTRADAVHAALAGKPSAPAVEGAAAQCESGLRRILGMKAASPDSRLR